MATSKKHPSDFKPYRLTGKEQFTLIILCAGWALIIFLTIYNTVIAADFPERHYQQQWCDSANGKTEVVLADRTRVDCETKHHAIEFDFGRKWAESIGQALGYAVMTGKRPGIVLIIEKPRDLKYWHKLNSVVASQCLPITLWCTGAACESQQ